MMNQEFKTKWVEALRSGEYEQGESVLKDTSEGVTKYCCLGVACKLLVDEGVAVEYSGLYSDNIFKLVGEEEGDYEVLSEGIANYLGILSNPIVKVTVGTSTIADLNDTGTPFSEIADIIEEQL